MVNYSLFYRRLSVNFYFYILGVLIFLAVGNNLLELLVKGLLEDIMKIRNPLELPIH